MEYDVNNILIKLKDIRQDLDMTQRMISDKLDIKQGVYSRWESGKEVIPLRRLNQLCNLLHCRMDYITGLSLSNKKSQVVKEIDLVESGKRLRSWRKNNHISQQELANFLNTTQSTISAYESGKALILTAFAYQIAKSYNVSMDWLTCRSENQEIRN